ncbi:sulfur oxidation c-type cytochrome SoxX [Roseomonas sp. HF4]|uniref:sulfur oxidation c-type cytochrome SoxX n=1 Tax=Roseomonas sp. HF4 TaxID=2562313 RepID=UPI001980BA0A|nr:sulfur oxidation c-type cytochrome SoxX [Roseomonas sp. HF4]
MRFGSMPILGAAMLAATALCVPAAAQTAALVPFAVVDDAIPLPLTTTGGDAARGRALALDRSKGNCVTCHELPVSADFQGNLGPPLTGVADRYSIGELRLRVVDSKRNNAESNMPPYYRVEGLTGVRRDWAGRPILTAQEVEDVLAYLMTLR